MAQNPQASLNAAALEDGDGAFYGFRSRVQAATLPPGLARYLENMRCNRGTARPRKGTKALATDVQLVNAPVVLDFDLPAEFAAASLTRTSSTARLTFGATKPADTLATVGSVISVDAAAGAEFNGDFLVTARDASGGFVNWVEYTVTGTPATPDAGAAVACINAPALYETASDAVRGSCVFTSRERVEGIVFATTDQAYLYRDGQPTVVISYPAGEQVLDTDACALEQYLDQVYLWRGYQTATPLAVASITCSGSTVTVQTATPHGRVTNDWVYIAGGTGTEVGYNGLFKVTKVDDDEFTYTLNAATPTSPGTAAAFSARPCKAPLVWDGNTANDFVAVPSGEHPDLGTLPTLIRMPPADWGIQFNRRLVLPYSRDTLIMSDFSEPAKFDRQYAALTILPGGNDWLVGTLPYQELRVLTLYRKSAHLVSLATTTLAPVAVKEITREFGCVARRTACNYGDLVLWLSDLGMHGCRIDQNLNLVPLAVPLSEPIQDLIDGINWSAAGNAVARIWDNRLFLAVPYGSSTKNNRLFVFNFLNRTSAASLGEWESVDVFQGDFDVQDLHILDYQGRKRLHVLTTYGFVFVLDELEVDEWGNTAGAIGTYPISGRWHLRDYVCGTKERKKFLRLLLETNAGAGDVYSADIVTRNPDNRKTVLTYAAAATTDVSHKVRVPRLRGKVGTIEITSTAGRPEILAAGLEAVAVDRNDTTRS